MSMIRIDLPPDVERELAQSGVTEEAGMADWVADAIRQKLAATRQLRYLQARAARGDRERFREVLAKVPAVEPADDDRWQK